jgi:arylsulfatase A-like enzyme
MCHQLQGRVFEPDHPCQTPNLDQLAARGMYCKNSPAYEEIYNIPLTTAGPGLPQGIESETADYTTGFAEYFGNRHVLTYRVTWDGLWQYIHNDFDMDELCNLDEDPWGLHNRTEDPDCIETCSGGSGST